MLSICLLLCSIIFIFYTTNFIINKRKKEFGIYILMRVEQKNIVWIFFFESLKFGIISIILGIIIGSIISNFISSIVTEYASNEPMKFQSILYYDTIFDTIKVFIVTYIFIGLINCFILTNLNTIYSFKSKFKLIELKEYNKIYTYVGLIYLIVPLVTINVFSNFTLTLDLPVEDIAQIDRIIFMNFQVDILTIIYITGTINTNSVIEKYFYI